MIDLASNTGRNSSDATTRAQKKLRGRSLDGPRRMKERTKKIGSSISPVRRTAKGTRTMIDTLRLSELEFLDELIVDDSPNEHEPASNEQRKAVLASLNKALSSWDDADEDFFDATRAVQKNLRGLKSSDATRGQKNQRGRSVDRMKKMVEGAKKLVVRDSNGETPVQKKERSRSLGRMMTAGKIVEGAKMLVIRDSNGASPVQKKRVSRSLGRMMSAGKTVEGAKKLVELDSNGATPLQKKERSRSLGRMNIVEGAKKFVSTTSPARRGLKKSNASKERLTRGTVETLRQPKLDLLDEEELDLLDELIMDASPNKHERPTNKQRKIVLASLDDALSSWDDAENYFDF